MMATQAGSREAKRGIAFWRGKPELQPARAEDERSSTAAHDDQRFRDDDERFTGRAAMDRRAGAVDSTRYVEPSQHAAALLDWLQGPGGRTGTLTVPILMEVHADMCAERSWEIIGWKAVGRELRKLLGHGKVYAMVRGKRAVVYRVPPCDAAMLAVNGDRTSARRAA